ncbi:MAG: glutamate--tRNA ligase [Candidatus Omnitrophota bacterium]|nr:glutamate--tRNA ligase [Candidatus Omnitrophota bacterium]
MSRVRFAPSPTGYLHIGGLRTALFNYLYARSQKGQFLLRIEDTDRQRSKPEFEKEILDSIQWAGLSWDEEIVYQSRRISRYQEVAGELVSKGLASEEKGEAGTAVKFKIPPKQAVFDDLVHGKTSFDAALFDDLVILKSDGYPTYHLACVVDDHDMQISHIIRGDDHLSNTPRQILLCEALGWKPPQYAHLPLILGEDGSPLSKRHGAVAASSFKREGFLPEGLLNYLMLLGWGEEGNQEFYQLSDAIRKFSIKRINKSSAKFNWEKLAWLNAQHIKKLSDDDYVKALTPFYEVEAKRFSHDVWRRLVLLYRPRIRKFSDLRQEASYIFSDVEEYDSGQVAGFLSEKGMPGYLAQWLERANGLKDFEDHAQIELCTRSVADEQGLAAKLLIHPLRYALTASTASPGLFELMSVLGKDVCLQRVRNMLAVFEKRTCS